ncbi:hypothetical protein [Novosphingobium sediminis]|nr:hypothetical protein [Novosphingobium sediminis]
MTLFTAWCALLVVLSAVSSWFAWTPFSDEERPSSSSSGYYRGPTHK